MKITNRLFIPRRYALLYFAFEYGNKPKIIYRQLDCLPRDIRGWFDMSAHILMRPLLAKHWTLRDLNDFAARIREAISYQEGRLGKPLTAGGGCVSVSSE